MRRFTQYALVLVLGLIFVQVSDAQRRYLEPSFGVNVDFTDVQFAGSNYTVLPWIAAAAQGAAGNTLEQPLPYFLFTPDGDTETERPLVIYLHTGNFFPFPANGSCGGTITDSTNIEVASRLASMGYVVALATYRQGWLPTHPEELVRRYSLINGAYRGVQDVNTYIRHFKLQAEALGIDPDRIVVWGQGTGGYLSINSAFLNEYNEINTTSNPDKFQLPTSATTSVPMVIEGYNGDISGVGTINQGTVTNHFGIVDATYNALSQLPVGDTLFKPNYADFADVSDDFALAVNTGGALGDSTWINAGETPIISVHTTFDPFAPYETDVLLVPTATGPQPVVEVSGSGAVQRIATRLGINDIFNTIPEGADPIGDAIDSPYPGLFPISSVNGAQDDSAPWEWVNPDTPGLIPDDCPTDGAFARTMIDSIIQFYAPRACVALNLNCDFAVSTTEINLDAGLMTIAPNPATESFVITTKNHALETVTIYDLRGQTIIANTYDGESRARIDVNGLQPGMYIVKANVEDGVITQRVMVQ